MWERERERGEKLSQGHGRGGKEKEGERKVVWSAKWCLSYMQGLALKIQQQQKMKESHNLEYMYMYVHKHGN